MNTQIASSTEVIVTSISDNIISIVSNNIYSLAILGIVIFSILIIWYLSKHFWFVWIGKSGYIGWD